MVVLVSKKPSSFLVDSYERNDVLPMDDASGCQNDVREVVCMWRDVMWESQFGIPRREEDLKGSRRELDRLAIFLRCVPSVAKVATRVVFFKQNVRRALRGAKDKNSRRGGEGRWDLYICWHGSASTSINRGLDDRWSRRFLAMATTISLSLSTLYRDCNDYSPFRG